MMRQRRAMTLIEMVVCLAIAALCLTALVRGVGGLSLLDARDAEDAALVPAVEELLSELEGAPPQVRSGTLTDGWHYETRIEGDAYVLRVSHERWDEQHDFLIREQSP